MKRINYFVSLLMVLAVVLFASITGVSAASSLPSSVTTDKLVDTSTVSGLKEVEYIKNFPVIVKTAENGKYFMYCMNIEATYDGNVKFAAAGTVADGYLYILNSNPNTGDKYKDFYIKQMAVWYYEDYLSGDNNNLEKVVKQYIYSHKDSEVVSNWIYKLGTGAMTYTQKRGTLSITKPASLVWAKQGDYYVSQNIQVNSSNLSGKISYGLKNAPLGTKITNGTVANTIQVKVPAGAIPEGKKLTLTLTVSGAYNKQTAYYYYNSSKYQKLLFQDAKDSSVALSDSYEMTLVPPQKVVYKVEYVMHGHGDQVPTEYNIEDGGKATKPTDPKASGWKFEGWYIDAAYTKLYDFNTAIHEDKVLHAKWTQIVYKAEFVMHGHGAQVPTQNNIPDGGKVVKPADPTAQGWKFEGWYIDAAYTKPYDFNTAVHENKVIHAKWTPVVYKVEFVMHGHGDQVPTQNNIPDGGKATDPNQQNVGEWIFEGWYEEYDAATGTYSKPYNFNTEIHENKVLHAKWSKKDPERFEILISKTDVTKTKEVAGATLEIFDENGVSVMSWVSTTEAKKVSLLPGVYTLKETSAPTGYKLTSKTITFKVTATGDLYEKNSGNTYTKVAKIAMVNELLDVVSIVKRDKANDKVLSGAVLVIKDTKNNVVKRFTTGNGATNFDLAAGEYVLVEETAPVGYVKSTSVVYFKLLSDGTLQVKNSKGEYVDSTVVTFYNEKKKEEEVPVPKTDLDSTIYVMSGLVLLAGGVYFANKTIKEY